MRKPLAETSAHEIGISHGYDHANFTDAYGADLRPLDEVKAATRPGYVISADAVAVYDDGFNTGMERFTSGQWPDGTTRDDD